MIKFNIINMKNFLMTVNGCGGAVYLVSQDGRKENINKQYGIQEELQKNYRANKNYLPVSLDIPTPEDYLGIVYFTIGDC